MKQLMKISFVTLLMAFAHQANAEELSKAGLFVEPMVTYQTGDTKLDYPAPLDSSEEHVKGLGLGVRLGFHVWESVFLGVDARYSMPRYESSALDEAADAKAYNGGITLGAQTPVAGLRVWGTYLLTGELDPEGIGQVDVKYKDLKGYRIGAGLYIGVVSLNLEYENSKYDTTEFEKLGPISGDTDDITGDNKYYILSVSFPVSL
jgi:hypothetical protein